MALALDRPMTAATPALAIPPSNVLREKRLPELTAFSCSVRTPDPFAYD